MSKLTELKEKVAKAQAGLTEKLDNIPALKKWRDSRSASAAAGPDPLALSAIYRSGGLVTRLQVLLVLVLALGALGATGYVAHKMWARMKTGSGNEALKKDYSQGLEEMSQKVREQASLVSLGKFTVNARNAQGKAAMMSVDIWLKLDEPDAALFVQKNETIVSDRITEALNESERVGLTALTEAGNEAVKQKIAAATTAALPKGKVVEVFFHNLVVQ